MAPELLRYEPDLHRNFVTLKWMRLLSLSLLLIITTFTPALHAQDHQDNKDKISLDTTRS